MKHIFSILLLCLIFQKVITTNSLKKKTAKVAHVKKLIPDSKEKKLRKLTGTDEVDEDYGSSLNGTTETNTTTNTTHEDRQAENVNATAENVIVPANKPVSTITKTTGNKKAQVQINKFYGFNASNTNGRGKVTFGTYFYFFGRPIVKYIIMRLRITYTKKLRNLEDTTIAESAKTNCTIVNESLAGKNLSNDEGENVNYKCEANTTAGDPSSANFTLNTDVPITMVNANGTSESLNFTEINFNGNSGEESASIQNNTVTINSTATLKYTNVSISDYILIFTGILEQNGVNLSEKETITMSLLDNSNTTKKYNCTLQGINSNKTNLSCDTSSNKIRTTVANLHLSSGYSFNGTLFTIEMNENSKNGTFSIVTDDSYFKPPIEEYKDNTNSTQAENVSATAKDAQVDSSKPVSTKGQVVDSKDFSVQVMKFHSFERSQQGNINFGTFFHFIGKRVPYSIIFRLRINYNSRLRLLQSGKSDSVRTDCIITDEHEYLYGASSYNGINVNYNCAANSSRNNAISQIQINTDINLTLVEKNGTTSTLDFSKVSFNGLASEEATNIQSNTAKLNGNISTIRDATAVINNYYLIISGLLESSRRLRRLDLSEEEIITMNFKTNSSGKEVINKYDCTFETISSIEGELSCDTTDNPINTTVKDLHLSTGSSSDGTLVTIQMRNWATNKTSVITSSQNHPINSKSSGGLSGGAIAGIVIGCVVALGGILALAIFLRKPSAPLDNTTGIDFKNESTEKI